MGFNLFISREQQNPIVHSPIVVCRSQEESRYGENQERPCSAQQAMEGSQPSPIVWHPLHPLHHSIVLDTFLFDGADIDGKTSSGTPPMALLSSWSSGRHTTALATQRTFEETQWPQPIPMPLQLRLT
jgi:hypothetical protein